MPATPVRLDLSSPTRGPRGKPPRHFVDLTPDERVAAVTALGEKPFRAKQLATHYFTHLTADAAAMTDLPAASRDKLVEDLFPRLLTNVRTQTADGGTTVKTLWHLFDQAKVESVLMRYASRTTLCISSQAGCGLACAFCATGQMGLTRNLSTAEIVEQVREAARALQAGEVPGGPTRLSNVVFMGMGEPLANYKAIMATVRTLVAPAPDGLGMSARNVTVSTVGMVPAMRKLADEGIPVTLALSLHAPDDELRSELVPVNTRWDVDEALDAAYHYFEVTGRRVSIEYALIRDINDHAWRADLLGEKLNARGRGWVHCNPIPLNPVPNSKWTASDPRVEQEFVARLRAHGIPTTIRDTRGSDIDGACGQLAAEEDE
ncbi:23S rRNA (adenine(2503)-C(2))-methyltransferase RlmN [Cellulomonas sp. DKR-3]|uniref:Probable dual-specificity RNA methyltransferase RlmN n=1 Tax=Cellulomonas fulva TaxID=2835530 RepID=A0ABS5U2V2_9CELL|nr:23S rRNA (adenine(2503)-C(2))-methyltransferase RlmN [Cellulomonas fulva]MBT0995731.1 23S rRNA (adenine(2503)-C(2))-methyltransferase RlmN [Cellulomonas fulva]